MNSMKNRVQLIGNLGKDPDVKEFEGGKKVARFSVATNDSYENNNGEKVKETQWHNIVAWGKTATFAKSYLTKGREVAIEGKLTTRSWEDKDGNKKYISEVVAGEILLLGSKK